MMKKNSVDGDDDDYKKGTAKKRNITKQFRPPRCKERKTQRQQVWHIRGKGELLLLLLLKGRCRERYSCYM
jgi:hypothetical protein